MEGLAVLAIVVIALVVLDVSAMLWGVDSRPTISDTHGNTDRAGTI